MEDRKRILSEYYSNDCEEDTRLEKDNAHKVEFITTLKYIDKYLKEGDKILEVGAGTGKYSLYYAEKGYDVTAIEYVGHNVDILKSKIKDDMNIVAMEGDAVDLSRFSDNTFDVTLVLGPLYHLYTKKDRERAVSEAIRVTKKNGYIYLAYLTSDSIFISYCLKKRHLLDKDLWDDKYKMLNKPEEIFSSFYISEFKDMLKKYGIDEIKNIATDGLSSHLKEYINELTEEEFKVWLDYHLSICEREDLQGYSNHMLYLCRKR